MGKQVYIKEAGFQGLYLPDLLITDLDILIDDITNSAMDLVLLIDGKEGGGKSFDGRLIGAYCAFRLNTQFDHNNVHFDTEKYIKFSESQPPFTINILDESRQALNKRRGMSKSNVNFTNWLSENRDKQQVHIIILPAIHDIDSYVSIWRMKLLIHTLIGHGKTDKTKSKYKLIRGNFKVFENDKTLQQVIFNKQKYGFYAYPKKCKYIRKIKFHEVFTESELDAYKKKKTAERAEKYRGNKASDATKYEKLFVALKDRAGFSYEKIGVISGLSQSQAGRLYRSYSGLDSPREDK